jgi:hypothetical protein
VVARILGGREHRGDGVGVEVFDLVVRDAGPLDCRGRVARQQPVAHRAVEARAQHGVHLSDRRVRQRANPLGFGVVVDDAFTGFRPGAQRQHQRFDIAGLEPVKPDRAERRLLKMTTAQVVVQRPRGFLAVRRRGLGDSAGALPLWILLNDLPPYRGLMVDRLRNENLTNPCDKWCRPNQLLKR